MTESANSLERTSSRIVWLDVAKILALFSVVAAHMGYYKQYSATLPIVVFFYCTGYTAKANSVKKQLTKDIQRIVIPYLVVSLISIITAGELRELVFHRLMGLDIGLYSPQSILIPTFLTIGWSIWWFLPTMFYGKTVLNFLLNLSKNRIVAVCMAAAVTVIGTVICCIYENWFQSTFLGMVVVVSVAVAFMLIGYGTAGIYPDRLKPIIRLAFTIVMAILFVILIEHGYHMDLGVRDIPVYILGNVAALAGVFAVTGVAGLIPQNRFCSYWGPKTMLVYCVHGLEHNLIPWSYMDSVLRGSYPQLLVMVCLFTIRVVFIFSLAWLVDKFIGVCFGRKK